jgi:hypothetical protein
MAEKPHFHFSSIHSRPIISYLATTITNQSNMMKLNRHFLEREGALPEAPIGTAYRRKTNKVFHLISMETHRS